MQESTEKKKIEVNMGEMKIAKTPDVLITRGLGSCLGITLYDPIKKIGTMAHAMLPDINRAKAQSNPNRFVNSVVENMLGELKKENCFKKNLQVKLFGGAHMFSFIAKDNLLNVGEKNIEMAKDVFQKQGMAIVAEELGGSIGRTIELDLESGKVLIKTISIGSREV